MSSPLHITAFPRAPDLAGQQWVRSPARVPLGQLLPRAAGAGIPVANPLCVVEFFPSFPLKSCCLLWSRMILGVWQSRKVLAQPVLPLLLVQSPVPGRSRPLKYLESYTCNSSLCPRSCLQHHPFIAVSLCRGAGTRNYWGEREEKKKKKKGMQKSAVEKQSKLSRALICLGLCLPKMHHAS